MELSAAEMGFSHPRWPLLVSGRRSGRCPIGSIVLVALLFAACPSRGADLPEPSGDVILTVTGRIEHANRSGAAVFDRSMLENLGLTKLTTWTPWTIKEADFRGVLARSLMDAVGAEGTQVRAKALNDYEVTIPLSDFTEYRVILAMYKNGRELTKREKGPLWIVYPWTDHPELDDRPTRQKSIWQLIQLHVY